jgi:DNA-binding PadR family transcriptional regulator
MNNEESEDLNGFKAHIRHERHAMLHRRNWLRHNAMVPKGFLRYHVLQALSEQPLSGSELMEQIQKHTGGHWKPSPGSIYPLLAWLQDNQYIKEMPTENGLKRYELTQSGKDLLEEQRKIREKIAADPSFMTPFFDRFYSKVPVAKSDQIRCSMKQLFISAAKLGKALRENYSEKELDEALNVLNETSTKLDEIRTKLTGEKHD